MTATAMLWLLLLLLEAASAFSACPIICTCKWRNGKRYVECRGQSLISVPKDIDPETQVLDLSGNDLQNLPKEVFARQGLVNLQKLYLRDCNLGQIDSSAFRGLTNLVELDLAGNLLTSVPIATFADIPYLRDLHLSGNPLQRVEANAFEMVPQLVSLDLSDCGLKRLAARAFAQLTQLQKLDLSNNQLQEIRHKTVDTIRGLHSIELSGNPWRCDCRLRSLKQWLLQENVPLTLDASCAAPPRIRGRQFARLDPDEFACPPRVRAAGGNARANNGSSQPDRGLLAPGAMPRYVEAKSGQNATIVCVVSSVPRARVRWFRHDDDSSSSDSNNNGDVLTYSPQFVPEEEDDEDANADAVVINPSAPPASQSKNGMPDVVSASAKEILNNSVSRRGEQRFVILEGDALRERGEQGRLSRLIITNVHEMDSGQYSCVAENRAGKAEANFTLQVGYFVGGVASLESSEIAGLAASLALFAVIAIVVLLVFLVRHGRGRGGSGSRNGSSGQFSHFVVKRKKEEDDAGPRELVLANGKANGDVTRQSNIEMTTTATYGSNGLVTNSGSNGNTVVINGNAYAGSNSSANNPDVVPANGNPANAIDSSDEDEDNSRSTTVSGGFVSGFRRKRKAKNDAVMAPVEHHQSTSSNLLSHAAASRETVLTSVAASPAAAARGGHLYANRLGSDSLYPAARESPILSHRDLIARSGMADNRYGTLQHQHHGGFYSPQLGGHGRAVSGDPNGGYANLMPQGATLPRNLMGGGVAADWRGSGGILANPVFQRVPPISEEIPSDFGLPTQQLGHHPDRVFSPIREQQVISSQSNLATAAAGAGSPLAGARLPTYHESHQVPQPQVPVTREYLERRSDIAPGSRSQQVQQSREYLDRRNTAAIGYSSNASAVPATPVGRSQQQVVMSPSSSDASRSGPAVTGGAGVNVKSNRTSESPDEGIQDDCSTDV